VSGELDKSMEYLQDRLRLWPAESGGLQDGGGTVPSSGFGQSYQQCQVLAEPMEEESRSVGDGIQELQQGL